MGKDLQEQPVHRPERRIYPEQCAMRDRFREHARGNAQKDHDGSRPSDQRHAERKQGQRAAGRDPGDGNRDPGRLEPRRVPDTAQKAFHGVPAGECPPEDTHQHLRSGDARAVCPGLCHPPVLHQQRLLLLPRPDHHGIRRRGSRRDVQREHARQEEPPAQGERGDRLPGRLLRQGDQPDRIRAAGSGNLRHGAGQGVHLWPHLQGGELEHLEAPGRVLDDRAGDGLL